MKQIVILICLLAFGMNAQAQIKATYSTEFNSLIDSVVLANTTARHDSLIVKTGGSAFGFDIYVKKNSGTLGSVITVRESIDASGWRMFTTPLFIATVGTTDTNIKFRTSYNPSRKYILDIVPTGTQNATYSIHGINRQ